MCNLILPFGHVSEAPDGEVHSFKTPDNPAHAELCDYVISNFLVPEMMPS